MTREQIRYCVPISEHYRQRYRERIARSKRIELFATEAFYLGREPDLVEDSLLRKHLEEKENLHSYSCVLKIHKGFVHVFDSLENVAVTVYKIPRLRPIGYHDR